MGLIHKRIPHFQKPEGPVEIDRSKSPSSLIGAWYLSEGAGNARELINERSAALSSADMWSVSEKGRVLNFDGSNSAEIDNSTDVNPENISIFTIGLQRNLSGTQTWASKFGDSAGDDSWIVRTENGVPKFYARIDGAWHAAVGPSINANQFYSFGGRYNGSTVTVSIDGVDVGTKAKSGVLNSASASIKFGRPGSLISTEKLNGLLYLVLIFNADVGEDEFARLHENPLRYIEPRRRWVPFSGAAGTTFNQAVSGSITPSGTLATALTIVQSLAGSITSTGALTFITSFKQTLTGSVSSTGTLARKISTSVEGSITATGSVLKNTIRDLAGSITSTGALASVLSSDILKTVEGSITATGALTKKVFRSLSGSISSTGAITKKTSIDLDGSISMSGDPDKGMAQDTSGSITPTGDLTASAPFVPAPDEGGGPGSDGSLAQRIRRVYGYFKRDGR